MNRKAFITMLSCLSLHRIVGWCHAGSTHPEQRRRTAYPWLREMRLLHEDGNAVYFRYSRHLSKQRQQHTSTGLPSSLATTTMLRGGNVLLGSTPIAITAQLSSLYLLVQGAAMVLAPHKVMLDVYGIETETKEEKFKKGSSALVSSGTPKPSVSIGKFNLYLVRAMGALSIGMAINLFLAMVVKIPVHKSIGYGLLPRLLFILASFVLQTFEKVGMTKKYLQANSVGMAWTCVSLLTGVGKPVEAAKTFSSVALAKAVFLLFRPAEATEQYFGVDVSGMRKTRALCRAFGDFLAKSAVLMGLLMFEKDPAVAAAATCFLTALLEWDKGFVSKTYKLVGAKTPWAQCTNIGLALVFAAGFLWEDATAFVVS